MNTINSVEMEGDSLLEARSVVWFLCSFFFFQNTLTLKSYIFFVFMLDYNFFVSWCTIQVIHSFHFIFIRIFCVTGVPIIKMLPKSRGTQTRPI